MQVEQAEENGTANRIPQYGDAAGDDEAEEEGRIY